MRHERQLATWIAIVLFTGALVATTSKAPASIDIVTAANAESFQTDTARRREAPSPTSGSEGTVPTTTASSLTAPATTGSLPGEGPEQSETSPEQPNTGDETASSAPSVVNPAPTTTPSPTAPPLSAPTTSTTAEPSIRLSGRVITASGQVDGLCFRVTYGGMLSSQWLAVGPGGTFDATVPYVEAVIPSTPRMTGSVELNDCGNVVGHWSYTTSGAEVQRGDDVHFPDTFVPRSGSAVVTVVDELGNPRAGYCVHDFRAMTNNHGVAIVADLDAGPTTRIWAYSCHQTVGGVAAYSGYEEITIQSDTIASTMVTVYCHWQVTTC